MKRLIELRAIQVLHGDEKAVEEILRTLKKTKGNMRDACALLGIGRSSMYRLIDELAGAREKVDALLREHGYKIQGKVLDDEAANDAEPEPVRAAPARKARVRTRTAAPNPSKPRTRTADARR